MLFLKPFKLGRKGIREKGQSRTIDIDILFFGKEIIKTETLVVPHYEPDFELAEPEMTLKNCYKFQKIKEPSLKRYSKSD